jgi:hypothetical protein
MQWQQELLVVAFKMKGGDDHRAWCVQRKLDFSWKEEEEEEEAFMALENKTLRVIGVFFFEIYTIIMDILRMFLSCSNMFWLLMNIDILGHLPG